MEIPKKNQHQHRHRFFLLFPIIFLFALNNNQIVLSSNNISISSYYAQCSPSTCGSASILQFPFGLDPLCRAAYVTTHCNNNNTLFLTDDENPRFQYNFLHNLTHDVYSNNSVNIVDVNLLGCGPIPDFSGQTSNSMKWLTIGAIYLSSDRDRIVTYFNCSQEPDTESLKQLTKAPCLECGETTNLCYYYDGYLDQVSNCRVYKAMVPVKILNNATAVANPRRELQQGFTIVWDNNCNSCTQKDDGRCGYVNQDRRRGHEVCFCRDAVHTHNCSDGQLIKLDDDGAYQHRQKNGILQLIIGLGIGLGGGLAIASILYVYIDRRRKQRRRLLNGQDEQVLNRYLKGDYTTPASVETFLLNYTSGRPTRFSFKQLKKYTNNFNHKLGQGGFGSVFKGELPNGFPIAVKLIDETDHSEVQFLNEVLTIGKIHHNYLVRLLGYSFEQSKQALVYEFMKNGSLDKYIHGRNEDAMEKLSWSQLVDIAIGTAKGIAYLHEECRIRILHCDIKPHNILLDDKFQPKVADFGLAQALNREMSHASLAHGAGTPGYAAPETWWKSCGPVTDKSDVYSFGMVVLEMVGKRRNFKGDVSKSSEMYFPEWVYKHHVMNASDGSNGGSKWRECEGIEEEEMGRRMELVGLWCIQFHQSRRPSMRRVIEMLEGNLEIQIPPSPFQPGIGFTTPAWGSGGMPVLPELGSGTEESSSAAAASASSASASSIDASGPRLAR
ncbi:LEAF RUST 10 DISEASE-RESISTANCE LOCUS RECEPTOR-LIKE PROTEIN KINASE-like 2.1 [Macadamia integrifolia]|uniref:LEAF RUST 10 DISEASE-RESISTANCE LOCUS RECEPTOR-LIKE PROTEIN KINASE-like 2.1 n=1 Tax=Macadamia integrifolia TaxID=60698 RepID=UPI001C4EE783|nr:LEAF RUST 10 DISEASE-RESISTANCE LOCUS RECEPTOR-LIKE PROTEIN KINASE-like 2.1 [Macadamia integrifolia]